MSQTKSVELKQQPFVSEASRIGGQLFLRADPKYRFFWDVQAGITINPTGVRQVRMSDCFLPFTGKTLQKGALGETRNIIDLADVENYNGVLIPDVDGSDRVIDEIGSTRLEFGNCDLVFSRLEPYLGKVVLNDPTQKWIGTTEWMPLRVDSSVVLPIFLKWLLLQPAFLGAETRGTFWKLRGGKRHARISAIDFRSVRIPLPSLNAQRRVESELLRLDARLSEERRSLKSRPVVIDEAVSRALGYERADFRLPPCTPFKRKPSDLGKSFDLRTGVRFLRPEFDRVEAVLRILNCVRLRELLDRVRTRLGATITPEDYDSDGEACYISPDVIKGYVIDFDSATRVSEQFEKTNRRLVGLQEGDIVISRSGIGIGKVALFENGSPALFSDFTMRLRFSPSVAPFYAYAVCCSSLFQAQITRHKRGAAMPNFFPVQVKEFWFPMLPKPAQEKVVEKVKSALEEMRQQETRIVQIRADIDKAVRSTYGEVSQAAVS